jgi:hypothetical protein
VLKKIIKIINKPKPNFNNELNYSLIIEKLCIIIEGNLTLYKRTEKHNKQIICDSMKSFLMFMYLIFYNIKDPKNIVLFFKMNSSTTIKTLKKVINIFKNDTEGKSVANFVLNLCFDDLKKKIYSYNDNMLAEEYQKYVYSEILSLYPSFNDPFNAKNEEYINFMNNVLEMKMDDYINNLKKENSDIFCKNLIPLLLSHPNFNFVNFYTNITNKHIEIIRKEYDNELTSLFRKDDVTNDLTKNLIYIFGNYSFVKSFYLTIPNEYLSVDEVNFNLDKFENFWENFIIKLVQSLPYIIKVMLNIINNCLQKMHIGTDEQNYNVVYTVLIFNFFISPTVLELYGLNIVKYKSIRQLTRILRNLCFGKQFDKHDKLSYFNTKIKQFNSFVNEKFKKYIFDIIDIDKEEENVNKKIKELLINAKNSQQIQGDESIILPSFCYEYYWENIMNVLKYAK